MSKLTAEQLQRRLMRGIKECGFSHTVEDIQQAVAEGRMQSWVNDGSLVITEVLTYPRSKKLNVVLVVGDFHDIMALQPQLDAFAREHGCDGMFTTGRVGLLKRLPAYGWKPSNKVIFERSL